MNSNFVAAVQELGDWIHGSGKMFGCDTKAQGRCIAFHCITSRTPLLSIPQEFHLMDGKLSMKAEAMLGRLQRAGGHHRVIRREKDDVCIEITYKGESHQFGLTWADVQQETYPYVGKEKEIVAALVAGNREKLKIKGSYATPYRRMQQMWARVVSDGMRTMAAELITGAYTPGEVADFTGLKLDDDTPPEAAVAEVKPSESPVAEASTPSPEVSESPKPEPSRDLSSEHAEIAKLMESLGVVGDKQAAVLNKYGADAVTSLDEKATDTLLANLRKKLSESNPSEAESNSIRTDGPITRELEQQIRQGLKSLAQLPDGPETVKRVQEKLAASGLQLAQLSFDSARKLLAAVEGKEAELFFNAELQEAVPF